MSSKYRSSRLRDNARDAVCCSCGATEGVVWAHSNESAHGKGMGTKSHDLLGLYLCYQCHSWYDERMSRDEARQFFRENYPKTMVQVAEKLASGELKL